MTGPYLINFRINFFIINPPIYTLFYRKLQLNEILLLYIKNAFPFLTTTKQILANIRCLIGHTNNI